MEKPDPFDLPEIRLYIAEYLEKRDLILCLGVCKAWHQYFLPFLWKQVSIRGDEIGDILDGPMPDALEQYSALVLNLHIEGTFHEWYNFRYPKLHTLGLVGCVFGGIPTALIANTPSLVALKLSRMGGYLGLDFWKAVSDLRLQSLSLDYQSTVDPDATELFVKMCTGLGCLEVGRTKITNQECFMNLTFPRMRRLALELVEDMKPMDQLDFVNRFPHLDSLTWHWRSTEPGISAEGQQFARRVALKTWPNLERVDLLDQHASVQDEDVALILDSMVLARELGFERSAFGPRAFQAMRRHFRALRVLKLTNCRAVTYAMIQDIMCSCPHLQDAKMGRLLAKHMVDGRPWVCLSLRTLQIRIMFHAKEHRLQPLVFQQLSRLVHLESLHTGGHEFGPYIHELDFRLQSGLGALASLKEMRHLHHFRTRQLLGVEEVKWIAAHWTKLKTVYGSLNMDPAVNMALRKLLKSHGIHAS